ncbi:MAG: hypothetical protein ABSE16_11970 [Verrucomicrobiota bacterium]|jgi:GNAT superfamily N-acetyltransferase
MRDVQAGRKRAMLMAIAVRVGNHKDYNGGKMAGLIVPRDVGAENGIENFSRPNGSAPAEKILIRPYETKDRDAVRRICCDTGVWGNPVESLFNDRELFADLFTNAYLDHEPEWALVAEDHGRVVGYLLGSVCPNFDRVLIRSGFQTTLKMLGRLAAGRYARHPRSRRFIRWLLTAGFWEQPRHPARAAHLHFEIDKHHRGQGLARLFWLTYEKKLRAAGVKQCYGAFFSHPDRHPELVYSRFGFSIFDRKRTTMFEPEMSGPVEVVCIQKVLQPSLAVNGHSRA